MEERCFGCFMPKQGDGPCPHCGYDPAADAGKYPLALPAGSILNGRYKVGRVLGQGGFGITYVAQEYGTGKLVAIKEYLPGEFATRASTHEVTAYSGQLKADFDEGKNFFLNEARTLAEFIGNANIVTVYSFFEENGTAYFSMEYLQGIPLNVHVKRMGGRLSPEEASKLLIPVMNAVSEIHKHKIVHRDIAPDNIMVLPGGRAVLFDFGAARFSTGEKSKSLDLIVKHGFAPVEQYRRHSKQGPFTDVYAMGATYYYAITGKVPPDSVERTGEDQLKAPSAFGVLLPAFSERALMKALAVQEKDRFPVMQDFVFAFCSPTDEDEGDEADTGSSGTDAGQSGDISKSAAFPSSQALVTDLLRHGYENLERKKWNEATELFKMVLNHAPNEARAYLGMLLAELHVERKEFLSVCKKSFSQNQHYLNAVRCADVELRTEIETYARIIDSREAASKRKLRFFLSGGGSAVAILAAVLIFSGGKSKDDTAVYSPAAVPAVAVESPAPAEESKPTAKPAVTPKTVVRPASGDAVEKGEILPASTLKPAPAPTAKPTPSPRPTQKVSFWDSYAGEEEVTEKPMSAPVTETAAPKTTPKKMVFTMPSLELAAADNGFNSSRLGLKLEPNELYTVTFSGVSFTDGATQAFGVRVYDFSKDAKTKVLCSALVDISMGSKDVRCSFRTPAGFSAETDIIIYAGLPGKTEGVGASFEGIKVYKGGSAESLSPSASQPKLIAQFQTVKLEAADKPYNNTRLNVKLQPGKTYTVWIGGMEVREGETPGFSAKIFDYNSKASKASGLVDTRFGKGSYSCVLTAPSSLSSNADIVMYAGVSGKTEGIAVTYRDVRIYEGVYTGN